MYPMVSLYGYCMLNAALILGFVFTRFFLSLPLFKRKLLQIQRLRFARYSFIASISTLYVWPLIAIFLPNTHHSDFRLEPIVKIASSPFTNAKNMVSEQISQMGSSYDLPSIEIIINIFLVAGVVIFFLKYIYNLIKLKSIANNSICLHKMNNIHILFNHTVAIPFCWSILKNHYVVIPAHFLEKTTDMKLAIRHELQHIRQSDTSWLHVLTIIKTICFWNPVMKLWINYFDELQEFSVDETLMIRKKTSASAYAQCLVDAASGLLNDALMPQGALGINGFSTSILHRRVNMLFDYKAQKNKRSPLLIAYVVTAAMAASTSFAFASSSAFTALTTQQVAGMIKKSNINDEFQVTANREVVNELNNIRSSDQARESINAALQRMQKNLPLIDSELAKRGMPKDLIVIPLVESGYQPLDESRNPVKAAGIWQIIPSTAKRYGLKINGSQDQRMEMPLATQAALTLLSDNYKIYKNWKLAFVAYEIGEKATDDLIKTTGSRDAWVLANSPKAPPTLKNILAAFDAELIIVHNPSLVNASI